MAAEAGHGAEHEGFRSLARARSIALSIDDAEETKRLVARPELVNRVGRDVDAVERLDLEPLVVEPNRSPAS